MYKKNDIVELNIIDINTDGLGIAKIFDTNANRNIVFFVKDAIVGDKVEAIITKVNKNIIFSKALKIINKSIYRIEPKCDVANKCGGCQLLMVDYKKQLDIKKEMVRSNLINIAKIDKNLLDNNKLEIVGMDNPYNFRNKIIIPFGIRDGKIISGYYAGRTHYIIDNNYCATAFKNHELLIDIVKKLLKGNSISIYDEITKTGIFRQLMLRKANETNELSITFIVNDSQYDNHLDKYKKIANDLITQFVDICKEKKCDVVICSISLNINISNDNVLLGKKNILLYGNDYIKDTMSLYIDNKKHCITFNISDLSFYQTNIYMTKKLYETVFEFANIDNNDKVLDLYCGIGTMTLFAALLAKEVVGVEVVEKAVFNAKKNSEINNIHNVKFICRDLDNDLFIDDDNDILKDKYDVLIIDPPRKGLSSAVRRFIIEHKPKRIVYVSCDSATLSRDLKEILDNTDYKIDKVKIVDMFAHTMHVETVVQLI